MTENGDSRMVLVDESATSIPVDDPPEGKTGPVRETPPPAAAGWTKLIPPDRAPPNWWSRNRKLISGLEWALSGLLLLLAGYYLALLLFPPKPEVVQPPPPLNRETFRRELRALPPIEPDDGWLVEGRIGRWRSIVIHHSATERGSPESFDRYHREVRKWENGLGYHFVIGNGKDMPDGEVAVGKRWTEQLDGAHVRGRDNSNANSYSIGICLVGNFNESLPSRRQLAALKGLLAFLRKNYGIGLASINGHNAVAADVTDCPGKYFFVDEVALALANP